MFGRDDRAHCVAVAAVFPRDVAGPFVVIVCGLCTRGSSPPLSGGEGGSTPPPAPIFAALWLHVKASRVVGALLEESSDRSVQHTVVGCRLYERDDGHCCRGCARGPCARRVSRRALGHVDRSALKGAARLTGAGPCLLEVG